MVDFIERHAEKIAGVLPCLDRVVITGTLPDICHDKATGKTFLRYKDGKCLHYYYFYFIDAMLGLCYLRVPTWAPFRLQFYFNGHNLLAHKLDLAGIGYRMTDNAFVAIDDWERA